MLKKLFISTIVLLFLPFGFFSNSQIQFPTPEGYTTNKNEAAVISFTIPQDTSDIEILTRTTGLIKSLCQTVYIVVYRLPSITIDGKAYTLQPSSFSKEKSVLSIHNDRPGKEIKIACTFSWLNVQGNGQMARSPTSPTYYLKKKN